MLSAMCLRRVAVSLIAVVGACSGGVDAEPDAAAPAIEVEPAPPSQAQALNPEVATALAQGALFSIYDEAGAEPLPVSMDFGPAELEGQQVLRYDILVEVTLEGERVEREWRILVGTAADDRPAALRATELSASHRS
jgi:hypothetical protein